MRPEGVSMLRTVKAACLPLVAQLCEGPATQASFNASAHAEEQTSTGFPPTATQMTMLPSGQSHAAQVLSPTFVLPCDAMQAHSRKQQRDPLPLPGSLAT